MTVTKRLGSSFRDPSGFVFLHEGLIYRQINNSYKENYDYLMKSGLYETLVKKRFLIPHIESDALSGITNSCYKIIQPEKIPFLSYPYEWCFSQLRDTALLTLEIQKTALEFDMILKDASAYNIQFLKGQPIFIDTLSFQRYYEGELWTAYRQFCQHFLAPLMLMYYNDLKLNRLSRLFSDGIPLDLASSILPLKTYFILPILIHIHLHAKSQKISLNKIKDVKKYRRNKYSLLALVDSLSSTIKKHKLKPNKSEWSDYYNNSNYSSNAFNHKKQIIEQFISDINPKKVWDFGANDGTFSRIAAKRNLETIAFDADHASTEKNYLQCISENETNLLPLLFDLTSPSPSIGWKNQERLSIFERGNTDVALALALVHHLAIANNISFDNIVAFFNFICNFLIIEFVPKSDSQVKQFLAARTDIFTYYTQENFEKEFQVYFKIEKSIKIKDSQRILYLMKKKKA